MKASKRAKTNVAKDIVKLIRMLTPPGRFLKRDQMHDIHYGMETRLCFVQKTLTQDIRTLQA